MVSQRLKKAGNVAPRASRKAQLKEMEPQHAVPTAVAAAATMRVAREKVEASRRIAAQRAAVNKAAAQTARRNARARAKKVRHMTLPFLSRRLWH